MQQNYEVIRFVQQNGKYHIIMDYVEGELLCNYIRKECNLKKEQLLKIFLLIAKEMNCLEKSDGAEYFPYLTPIHIVRKKDGTIAFLKNNEKYAKQMMEKTQPFIPLDGTNDYIYSYGRTIQFLLSNTECVPKLSWKEERKFKTIISKCLNIKSKKRYRNAQDIVNQLNPMKKKTILYVIPLLMIVTLALGAFTKIKKDEISMQVPEPEVSSYELLQNFLRNESVSTENEIMQAAKDYRQELGEEMTIAQMEFLFRVYSRIENQHGKMEACDIGEALFEAIAVNREILANIYLEQGEHEKAIREYEILLEEGPSVQRYLSLSNLLEQNGRHREAMTLCEEGSKFDSNGSELQLQYVKLLLLDTEYSVKEKSSKLEEFLTLYPAMKELEKLEMIKKQTGFEEEQYEN